MEKMNFNDNIVTEEEIRWAAYLNGEPDRLQGSNPDGRENALLTDVWETTGTHFSYVSANPDHGWNELQNKLEKSNKSLGISLFRRRVFQYAATVVMVVGIGFATYQLMRTPKIVANLPVRMAFAETNAHPSSITRVILPDGSTVQLNADTKIEYPEHFSAGVRKVKLSGEAFFEVIKDSAHPFRIETAKASVEVLGTSFNVSAYPTSDRVEVNVETGKVKLAPIHEDGSPGKCAILPAGERGWLKISAQEIGQAKSVAPNYAAWITKKLSFQRTPLSEVCVVLENTYHIKFKLENSEIGKIPYTANFAEYSPNYIADVIARTHHLKVKKSEDEIIFAKNGK